MAAPKSSIKSTAKKAKAVKAAKPVAKPTGITASTFKARKPVKFVTGSRWGSKTHAGTTVAFLPKDQGGVSVGLKVPASNRDRVVVNVDGEKRLANAKACVYA
jgi:hypothetical protein